MSIIALIPARGGSKRIPRKNIRDFAGKPMIAWSIMRAQASGCFDAVVVSTDDEEVAAIAREHGAEVPFMRPAELADDHATTLDVIVHALGALADSAWAPVEQLCCLYATAPFVQAGDLQRGLHALDASGDGYAVSVAEYAAPVQRALRLNQDGRLAMLAPEYVTVRSQDLEPAWHDAGQFYWGYTAAFEQGLPLLSEAAVPVVLPSHRVQDIDTEDDWRRAEVLFRVLGELGELEASS